MGSPDETASNARHVVLPVSGPGADSQQPDDGENRDLERSTSTVTLSSLESTWKGWVCVMGSFLFLVPSFG